MKKKEKGSASTSGIVELSPAQGSVVAATAASIGWNVIVVILVAIWGIVVRMIMEVVGDVDGGCNVDRGGGHKDGAAGDVKDDKG